MSQGFARFAKVRNGKLHFAEVAVRLDSQTKPGDVAIDCQGTGFQSQGHIETVPAVGYDDWKQGAVLGAKFALAAVKGPKLSSRRRNHRSNDWYQPVHCGSRMRPRRVECARGHSPRSCTSASQCHGPQQLQAPLRCITLL